MISLIFSLSLAASAGELSPSVACSAALLPRRIDATAEYERLVDWIHDEIIVARGAPGLVVGVSGTDSVVAFLAAADAFRRAGQPERAVAIHFANERSWFQDDIVPWLSDRAPGSPILVDESINSRRDGLRWGALLEWSVVADPATGRLRPSDERFWVVGTRNRTEEVLGTYSNASIAASVQPLVKLWKSEIIEMCRCLAVPRSAIDRSREADCTCGRDQLPARHIPEVDALLMIRLRELAPDYARLTIPVALRAELETHLDEQLAASAFKHEIPYSNDREPDTSAAATTENVREHLPELVVEADGARVGLVAARAARDPDGAPEAMALLNNPALRPTQRRAVIEGVLGTVAFDVPESAQLGRVLARIGYFGFAFPQWRLLTERGPDGLSLVEHYGFERLARATDLRDESLPASDPERDELGPGFVLQEGKWTIELRRAYLRITRHERDPVTLVIRNNSTYFGRDRLDEPFYVSFEDLSEDVLLGLDRGSLARTFRAKGNVLGDESLSRRDALLRAGFALTKLGETTHAVGKWLGSPRGGLGAMADVLEDRLARDRAPVYAAFVRDLEPSWSPLRSERVTSEWIRQARANGLVRMLEPARFVLMSGERGDHP